MTSPPAPPLPIAVVGAGAIGKLHIDRALRSPAVSLAAIVDPFASADAVRQMAGDTPMYQDVATMLARHEIGGAIIATPNDSHLDLAAAFMAQGIAVLVEKPLADSLEAGLRLCELAEACGVPVLVGHHRRHNPIIVRAKQMVESGVLGRPVCATVMATWLKPDAYFEPEWRRRQGAGPVLINLIHEIDLLRHLLGEVASVQAAASHGIRGFEVEDTATVQLRFKSGALASMTVTDAAVSPWIWDLNAGEAEHYPQQAADAIFLSGTDGSLSLPSLSTWHYRSARGWREELTSQTTAVHREDPYTRQLAHFAQVARREAAPLCGPRDAWGSLQVAFAALDAARSGTVTAV